MSTSPRAVEQQDLLFEQYKLAVEMAAGISARRQAANSFFIGLVSGFSVLDALLGRATPSTRTASTPKPTLLILPFLLCLLWWLTIYGYRRINKAKWVVIYELEKSLPEAPFTREREELGSKSFTLTKLELVIPLLLGLVFLGFALRSLMEWSAQ